MEKALAFGDKLLYGPNCDTRRYPKEAKKLDPIAALQHHNGNQAIRIIMKEAKEQDKCVDIEAGFTLGNTKAH